jgi:hypothetical protein
LYYKRYTKDKITGYADSGVVMWADY